MSPYDKNAIILASTIILVLLACNDDFSAADNGGFVPIFEELLKKPRGEPLDTPFAAFIGPHREFSNMVNTQGLSCEFGL